MNELRQLQGSQTSTAALKYLRLFENRPEEMWNYTNNHCQRLFHQLRVSQHDNPTSLIQTETPKTFIAPEDDSWDPRISVVDLKGTKISTRKC